MRKIRDEVSSKTSEKNIVRIGKAALYLHSQNQADVAELVDALDSGSSVRLGRGGSSPLIRTENAPPC